MRNELLRWRASFLGFALAITLAPGISGAQNANLGSESGLDRAMEQNGVKKDDMLHPNKTVKVNKAEEAAYKQFLVSRNGDPATRIQLGYDFTVNFTTKHYLPGVYGVLTSSYFVTGNTDKMFSVGSRAIQLDPQNAGVPALLAMAIPRRVKPTAPDAQASYLNGAVAAYEKCAATGPLAATCEAGEDAVKKELASGTKLSRD